MDLISKGAVAQNYGAGCGPIFFDNVECTGGERQLADCNRAFFGDCSHDQDAGAICALTGGVCSSGNIYRGILGASIYLRGILTMAKTFMSLLLQMSISFPLDLMREMF